MLFQYHILLQVTTIVPPQRSDDEDVEKPEEQNQSDHAEDNPQPEQAHRGGAIVWLRLRLICVRAKATIALSTNAVRVNEAPCSIA